MIEFRRRHRSLSIGRWVGAHADGKVFAYERRYGSERLLIVLNFCHESQTVPMPEDASQGRIMLSTFVDRQDEQVGATVDLRPDEGLIVELG
jgi:alpha-glucosidase